MPADSPHTYDTKALGPQLISVSRGSTFQIDYVMSDTTGSSFRCTKEFADFVIEAWAVRNSSSQIMLGRILEELQEHTRLMKASVA